MFELDRTFSQYSAKTGLTEWYFNAREGVCGPYSTKQKAEAELKAFIDLRVRLKDDGGRNSGKPSLSLMPMNFSLEPMNISHPKKKQNTDDLN